MSVLVRCNRSAVSMRASLLNIIWTFCWPSSRNHNIWGLEETWEVVWFGTWLGSVLHVRKLPQRSQVTDSPASPCPARWFHRPLCVLWLKIVFHQVCFWTWWTDGTMAVPFCEAALLSFRSSPEPIFRMKACRILNLQNELYVLLFVTPVLGLLTPEKCL